MNKTSKVSLHSPQKIN